MMSLLANAKFVLDSKAVENFEGLLGDILNLSKKVGLPIAGIMIVITVFLIFFGPGKDAPNHARHLIWICVGVIIIANIGSVVTIIQNIGERIFDGESDAYESLANYKPGDGFVSMIRTFLK